MTDHTAGGESRARCDAAHTKAKGPHARAGNDIEKEFSKFVSAMFGPPVLQPGTKVNLRVPMDEDDDGPFVVMGIITERGLHGTSVRYRIGSGSGDGFEVAPELVEAVPEVPAVSELQPLQVMPGREPIDDARFVTFNEVSPGLIESECGRYRLSFISERWSAFDTWTGETSPTSMERGPALEWVARRAGAAVPPLNWTDFADGARVYHMGVTFEVFAVARGRFKAFDPRFTAEAFRSPIFPALNKAKEWCAVRAMCESQPLPGGGVRPVLVV